MWRVGGLVRTTVGPRGTGIGLGGEFTLREETLQVGHEAETERILDVHALDGD